MSGPVRHQYRNGLIPKRLDTEVSGNRAQALRPFHKKDIDLLEKLQHRALRMVQEFRGWSYGQRLNSLRWSTLESRRLRVKMEHFRK